MIEKYKKKVKGNGTIFQRLTGMKTGQVCSEVVIGSGVFSVRAVETAS